MIVERSEWTLASKFLLKLGVSPEVIVMVRLRQWLELGQGRFSRSQRLFSGAHEVGVSLEAAAARVGSDKAHREPADARKRVSALGARRRKSPLFRTARSGAESPQIVLLGY
jgi:hypothetical protein